MLEVGAREPRVRELLLEVHAGEQRGGQRVADGRLHLRVRLRTAQRQRRQEARNRTAHVRRTVRVRAAGQRDADARRQRLLAFISGFLACMLNLSLSFVLMARTCRKRECTAPACPTSVYRVANLDLASTGVLAGGVPLLAGNGQGPGMGPVCTIALSVLVCILRYAVRLRRRSGVPLPKGLLFVGAHAGTSPCAERGFRSLPLASSSFNLEL